MIPSTAQLAVEMSKVEWQDREKKRWMASRDKAYDYYKGRTTAYTESYFSASLISSIVTPNINITKRIIDRISLVYMKAPIREYSNENVIDFFHHNNSGKLHSFVQSCLPFLIKKSKSKSKSKI